VVTKQIQIEQSHLKQDTLKTLQKEKCPQHTGLTKLSGKARYICRI
jgi:hypothetical protein